MNLEKKVFSRFFLRAYVNLKYSFVSWLSAVDVVQDLNQKTADYNCHASIAQMGIYAESVIIVTGRSHSWIRLL